jgi:AcrR family transcriptional regulator
MEHLMTTSEPGSRAALQPALATPRQARSQIGLERMLQTGRDLIEAIGNLDELSVPDIVERSGTSIGAFYRRFDSKDVFFDAVQARVMKESLDLVRESVAKEAPWQSGDARIIAEEIVMMYLRTFRRNRGLYHASLLRVSRNKTTWDVVKEANREVLALVTPPLAAAIARERRARKAELDAIDFEVRAALQLILGMLVNIVLNDPGPLSLTSRRLGPWLKTQFRRSLELT